MTDIRRLHPEDSGTPDADRQVAYLSILIQLQHSLRQAKGPAELACILVNNTLQLLPYRQAVFWEGPFVRIKSISGNDTVDANAPYVQFLKRLVPGLAGHTPGHLTLVRSGDVGEDLARDWADWLPAVLLVYPLQGEPSAGGLIFMRRRPWDSRDLAMLEQVCHTFDHAWAALKKEAWFARAGRGVFRPLRLVPAVLLAGLLCLPVRLSVLAPMEIIPRDPVVVAAPMDGAIKQFMVTPNQPVKAGDTLFSLDDIRLRNEYDIAQKNLAVIMADELRARQKAFGDEESRAELLQLTARIHQHQAIVAYLSERMELSRVKAEVSGVAVFNDVSDWLGKPVVVGEKIVTLADPVDVIAQIQLPVADAITLVPGAPVRIFLNISPETPIEAHLYEAAYEAQLTPDRILAFRLKARLETKGLPAERVPPRIGLRGTAKIYGKKVSVFYFLFRRPLASLRQFTGV